MLNDNSKVAVYPTDLTIKPGKTGITTIAVSNSYDTPRKFNSENVGFMTVYYYATPNSEPVNVKETYDWWIQNEQLIVSKGTTNSMAYGTLDPGDQAFKNILIKMPKQALKGQYVITVVINTEGATPELTEKYGAVKIYVTTK